LLPILGIQILCADLGTADIERAYGADYELIEYVPGRPWIEMQYRYQLDKMLVMCNFVDGRCLWIEYWVNGRPVDEPLIFAEMEKLFPGMDWTPRLFHGRPRWWFNADEDRVTLRAKGFTLHMNEYIRNVLSRREQWQF
jgi:hypothetical protein